MTITKGHENLTKRAPIILWTNMPGKSCNLVCSGILLLGLSACSSNEPVASVKRHPAIAFSLSHYGNVATHTKKEILTRQWQDSSGTVMVLLDFRVEALDGRPSLAIAKYGDKAIARVYCVDIFQYRQTVDPVDASLLLLCHDHRDGWVASVQIEQKGGQMFVNFERHSIDLEHSKTIRNYYSYNYDRKAGFSLNSLDIYAADELSPK